MQKQQENSHEARLKKFKELYKEAFGTECTGMPNFNLPVPTNTDETGKGSEPEPTPLEKELLAQLSTEGSSEADDPTCDDIPRPMADCLIKWFREPHTGTEIQETLKLCERPKNAEALKVIQLNPEIKKWMSRADDHKDQRMKWLATVAPKAAQPLARAWAQLCEVEFAMQQDQDAAATPTDALIPLNKEETEHCNISEIIREVKLALKCLGMVNVQINQKQRLDLQYKLSGAAKEFAEPNNKFDNFLFGADMDRRLAQIVQANKITQKVASPQKNRFNPFLGRGRARTPHRGGSRGYGQNYHNNNHQGHYGSQNQWNQSQQYRSYSNNHGNNNYYRGRGRGRGNQNKNRN